MGIKLTSLILENDNLQMMKKYGASAKKVAAQLLTKKGLQEADYFILRIKYESRLKDWVALYRSHTVMSGRPIFWINGHLPEIMKEQGVDVHIVRIMTDNILHEWWHAICESLRVFKMRGAQVTTPIDDFDEEDLAEKFISWCGGDAWRVVDDNEAQVFESAIKEFNALWA